MEDKVIMEVEVHTDKAVKGIDKVKDGVEETNTELKETAVQSSNVSEALDKATNGGVSGFRALISGIKSATVSTKAFGLALVATGIGAFVVIIGTLVANLRNSEEGFNRVQRFLDQLGVIAGNVTDIFYSLGSALFGLVTGDFELMNKSFQEAKNRLKNFGDETKREMDLAGELADQRAQLAKDERALIVERAEADRKRAELLEKAVDKENFSVAQRIKFLQEAGQLEEEITAKEVEAAKTRLAIKQQENTLSESSAEDLEAEANLQAEVIRLEQARLTKQKEVTSQIIGFKAEAKAQSDAEANARKADQAAEQAQQDAELKVAQDKEKARLDAIKAIQDNFQKAREDEAAVKESEKIQLEQNRALAELDRLNATEDEKLNIRLFYQNKLADAISKEQQRELAQEQALAKQKIALTADTLGMVAGILGQNSAAGKAAAIAQATINSYLAFTDTLKTPTTIPEPFGSIQKVISAGTILASGIATVKEIASVKTPAAVGGGFTSGTGNAPIPSRPPAFNIVGASEQSQLAQTIGENDQKPVKAFVVASDVSNAQALDRNIIESASIG